jgi:cell division protein FtsQ
MAFQKKRRRGATSLKREPTDGLQRWKTVWGPPLRWLGVLLVVVVAGYGVQIGSERLREPGAFPLRQIHTEGEWRNLVEADVHAVAEAYKGQNFFVANLDELNTALATNPWIETVAVRRWWPDTVEIRLRERTAFGYWGEREMVDVNGVRFQPTIVRQAGPWPRLVGPDGHEKALIEAYRQARALLDPLGLKLIRLVQDERRAWWLTFENGLDVRLGREQFAQRLQRLAQIYPRLLAPQIDRIAVVDLRYLNGFAVRWKAERPAPLAG